MNNSSPVNPINSGWNFTEGVCWPCYIGTTLDAKMTFERHLRSVSRAAARRLGVTRNSWKLFHDWSLLLRSCWCFVLPVLEYCSAVRNSAVDSHLKQLERVVRGASFFAGCVLDCNIFHWRSVALLCMLEIKSNPTYPLIGVHPLAYVPARVTHGALVAHRHSFELPHWELHSTAGPLRPPLCLCGTILMTLCLMTWDSWVLRTQPMSSCWPDLFFLVVSN